MENTNTPVTTRRKFINYCLGTSLGATLVATFYPIFKFLVPPPITESTEASVVAAKVSELKPNSGKIFKFGSKPGILVKTPSGEIRAFSATCTHLDCTVQYKEEAQHIWCACHNGRYDLMGKNVAGPPPRPLEQYTVNVRGDEIIVSKG
ncbi:MAG: ubiquinol-cytochrome c reductase iron-sulfur subunit [Acidobacteria bacterium]|nr:ubiquinol-cytochrome c reductase iron-sulfur subunit [Acidobacteriota bacterium]